MTATAYIELTDNYYEFVNALDPQLVRSEEALRKLKADCARLLEEMRQRAADLPSLREHPRWQRLVKSYEASMHNLEDLAQKLNESQEAKRRVLRAYHRRLTRNFADWVNEYESLGAASRAYVNRWKSLAPTNYNRNIFHVANGVVSAALYYYVLSTEMAVLAMSGVLGLFVGLDLVRRIHPSVNEFLLNLPYLKTLVRPREWHQTPSAVWYALGVLISVLFFPRSAVCVGLLVLGIADPLASIVGKRVKSMKLVNERSFAGSLTFFLSGLAIAAAFLTFFQPGIDRSAIVFTAGFAAFAGTLAELFSRRIDDNLSVVVASSFAAWFGLWAAGIPL